MRVEQGTASRNAATARSRAGPSHIGTATGIPATSVVGAPVEHGAQ